MKATANVMLSSAAPVVKLEHQGEILTFSISVFGRKGFQKEGYDVFSHINQFWASLPEQEQTDIFEIYRDIQNGLDCNWTNTELSEFLSDKIKVLLDKHNLDLLQDWIMFKSDIVVPSTFDADYSHSIENNTSREKTYTKGDYIKLVTLSLCLRCMIPIWGEHITTIRKDAGTLFKEFYSFQLLNKSNLINSIPIEKLRTYIEHIVGADKYDPNNTLKGISSEDFVYWLLSLVCIRRICVSDIRGIDPTANVITYIYKFIIQKIQNNDNNFENIVKEKTFDDKKSSDSENKISTLERYRIKTNISPGEIVELEYSIRDMHDVASKLTSNLNIDQFNLSLQTSHVLLTERILDPQTILLQWVFKPVISPRGLMYLPKPTIVRALGALEAVLWARGHKYLALLATSHAVISDKEMIISPVDSKMRVSKEYADELDRLYPFTKSVTGKKSVVKVVNRAAKSIDNVTESLMMFSWKPTAADWMLEEVFGKTTRRFPIKPDIKTDLSRLVIELGRRDYL